MRTGSHSRQAHIHRSLQSVSSLLAMGKYQASPFGDRWMMRECFVGKEKLCSTTQDWIACQQFSSRTYRLQAPIKGKKHLHHHTLSFQSRVQMGHLVTLPPSGEILWSKQLKCVISHVVIAHLHAALSVSDTLQTLCEQYAYHEATAAHNSSIQPVPIVICPLSRHVQ